VNRFVVWSTLVNELTGESRDVVEVSRSDRKVAEDDASLIRWVGHRKSWVQDSEES
jgi:hypothetical protein